MAYSILLWLPHTPQMRCFTNTTQVHQRHSMESSYALKGIICNSKISTRMSKCGSRTAAFVVYPSTSFSMTSDTFFFYTCVYITYLVLFNLHILKPRGLKNPVRTLFHERQKGSAYQGHSLHPLHEKNKRSKTLQPIPITKTLYTALLKPINL